MSRVLIVIVVALAFRASTAESQVTSLSGHFGALTIPARSAGSHAALSLNRFTPNGKPSDPGDYNAIKQTIGFNLFSYSVATASRRWPNLTRQVTLQAGWGHDQPTEWMQNTLHRVVGKEEVPSVDPRNHVVDAMIAGEIALWSAPDVSVGRFMAGGVSVGTPYSEGWIQAGATAHLGQRGPEVLVTAKAGVPLMGGVFPDSVLATAYGSFEARVEAPLSVWFGVSWLPSPFLGIQHATGFFLTVDGDPIAERHGTYGLTDSGGRWRLEIWNEHFGGQVEDKGPTGGGRLVVRLPHSARPFPGDDK